MSGITPVAFTWLQATAEESRDQWYKVCKAYVVACCKLRHDPPPHAKVPAVISDTVRCQSGTLLAGPLAQLRSVQYRLTLKGR